jgi:ketosteroid isomerase-like protein
VDRATLSEWIEGYERVWREPGTAALAGLFAPDAVYLTSPLAEPIRGLPAIRELWEAERDPGEEFAMTYEILAVDGDTGVVRVQVRYERPTPRDYRDLWIVRLGSDGRCVHFEEWFFAHPA